jgi:hypothetical protein
MTSLISARRAAEDFARVVDGTQQDVADRYADLTATVDLLRRHESPAARPEFVSDLRTRLMAAADTLLVPVDDQETGRETGTVVPLRPGRHPRRLAVAAAAFVVVGGTAGVAAAAESSLPGDPLYPIKRGIESAQVSLNSSDSARGQDLVSQAGTRLDEIAGLVDQGDASQISHTLASFQRSVGDGSDLLFVAYQRDPGSVDLSRLRDTIGAQSDRLHELAGRAPASTQPDFRSASALLADIDQQARVLCSNCGSGAGGFTNLSGPALENLINEPADAATSQQQQDLAKALAEKATQIASTTPTGTASGTVPTRDGSGQVVPGVSLPAVPTKSGSLTSTVTTVTGTVEGLVDSVGTATGLTPVTDTVNGTVDTVTGLLGGN